MPLKIILASSSKSRLQLLAQIGIIPDLIIPADLDETRLPKEKPQDMSRRLALAKCLKISDSYPNDLVIAADTVSAVGTRILDKTTSPEKELEYLRLISGRRHRLYTSLAVSLSCQNILIQKTSMSILKFKKFSSEEIAEYIACEQWKNCSGGYAVEGLAAKYLVWMSGTFANVMGLPLHELHQILSSMKGILKNHV